MLRIMLVVGLLMVVSSESRAELCLSSVDISIEKKSGYRWQWRWVDSRKCWFYSNRLLPKEDLIWAYTSQEFDSDIDRVIERKYYFPETMELKRHEIVPLVEIER